MNRKKYQQTVTSPNNGNSPKRLLQRLQSNGVSALCISLWETSTDLEENIFSQISHLRACLSFWSLCSWRMCFLSFHWPPRGNCRSQWGHPTEELKSILRFFAILASASTLSSHALSLLTTEIFKGVTFFWITAWSSAACWAAIRWMTVGSSLLFNIGLSRTLVVLLSSLLGRVLVLSLLVLTRSTGVS